MLFSLLFFPACSTTSQRIENSAQQSASNSAIEISDAALQQTAVAALGEREGAILVIEPNSGRLRAVVNPRLAFEQAFPPGSAIKPLTALAALRTGVLTRETRRLCEQRFVSDDFEIVCSHPKSDAPFDLTQAIGYSCNFFFAHTAQRLSEGAFNATLASFGFGKRTDVQAGNEAEGRLPHSTWRVQHALGESEQLLVTPVQLLTAFAALVNGGHLYQPKQGEPKNFVSHERARLAIAPEHRALLLAGMRGAVKYGTAERAGLSALPLDVFGKTGTSTASNGFRTNGWFVGFAATPSRDAAPEKNQLAMLVFLKRAHGAQAADVAKPVFEAFANAARTNAADVENSGAAKKETAAQSSAPQFKIHLVSAKATKTLSLEDYVRGVVAAEASIEDQPEALKAQAVVSRTFALRNRGRHAKDGYDFCSTTHCQRFIADCELQTADCQRASGLWGRVNQAVTDTAGEALRDDRGEWMDTYFHAACGGMTANIESLWGEAAPAYLRGVRDDYCATMPHRHWTQAISVSQLLKALRSEERSDVGQRLENIIVTKRDASGRAETLRLEGERTRTLRGWDFKLVVGRALGWQFIKSSKFEVTRAGANFVFRGGGFGHGLGLCQEGAHVMARRGNSWRAIVRHYFPGARVGNDAVTRRQGDAANPFTPANLQNVVMLPASQRILSSEHFRVTFPGGSDERDMDAALRILEAVHAEVARRLKDSSINYSDRQKTELIVYKSTGDFTGATGQAAWAAAVTRGHTIHLQPFAVLQKRGVLATTLRHEYVHVVIELLSKGRAPRWLAEGLAIHLAGEGALFSKVRIQTKLSAEELERRLERPVSAAHMRELYALAWREVTTLIQQSGEAKLWQQVANAARLTVHSDRQ